MSDQESREALERYRRGAITTEAVMQLLTQQSVASLGYANIDLQRRSRCGFPEVVFAPGKTAEQLVGIVGRITTAGQDCLATRIDDVQAAVLSHEYPQAEQDRVARTFWLRVTEPTTPRGRVVVVTAGTSDLPVAQEAAVTARCLGCAASRR